MVGVARKTPEIPRTPATHAFGAPMPAGINSLRLDPGALEALHAILEAAERAAPDVRREWGRWAMRTRYAEATFTHPGGTRARCVVSPRSISAGGIGVLHGGFVYLGSPCVVHLRSLDGRDVDCPGQVVRCSHISRHVHALGVKFEERIDPRRFVRLGDGDEAFTLERVVPEKLQGKALVLEPDRAGQRLIAHFLRATSLETEFADNPEAIAEMAQQGFDIVLIADKPGGPPAWKALTALRAARFATPVVLLPCEEGPELSEALLAGGAAACLCKPFDERTLHRALGEFLLLRAGPTLGVGAIASTLTADAGAADLIECFVRDLDQAADDASAALRAGDTDTCVRIALHLKGNGAAHGFRAVTDAAGAALDAMRAQKSLDAAGGEIRRLIDVCRRCTSG